MHEDVNKKNQPSANDKFSDSLYRSLFEQSYDGMLILDIKGTILHINDRMISMSGYSRKYVLGKTLLNLKLFSHFDIVKILSRLNQIYMGKTLPPTEYILRTKHKTELPIEASASLIKHDNRTAGILVIVRERKDIISQLKTQSHYQSLFEESPQAIVLLDNQERILDVNHFFTKWLGYTRNDLLRNTFIHMDFLPEQSKKPLCQEEKSQRHTQSHFETDIALQKKNGEVVKGRLYMNTLFDEVSSRIGRLVIISDITEQEKTADALKRRDAILQTVNYAAQQFFQTSDWNESLQLVIARLGVATDVSRVYVFKNSIGEKKDVRMSQLYEWTEKGVSKQIHNPDLQNLSYTEAGYGRWKKKFEKGEAVYGSVSDFPRNEQPMLREQDIKSLVVVPIYVKNQWWGYIGFDECFHQREWSSVEIEALQTAAHIIGAALEKNQREEELRSILHSVHDFIFVLDNHEQFVYVYQSSDVPGIHFDSNKLIHKKLKDVLPAQAAKTMTQILRKVEVDGKTHSFDYQLQTKEKRNVWFNANISPILSSHRQVSGFTIVSKNITKRKQAEEKMADTIQELETLNTKVEEEIQNTRKFQLAVEAVADHIVITDPDGIILYANPAVEKTTGYTSKEVLGTKAGVLWGKLMPKKVYDDLWNTIKQEKRNFSAELNNKRKNGERYIAQANIFPVLNDDNEIIYFVGIERDITKIKEIDRMKTEFISLASHQLRTPLSAMKWFTEMLESEDLGHLTKSQREAVHNVHVSNERMIVLVNSLLNVSRMESGRMIIEPTETNIEDLINETIDELHHRFELKNISHKVTVHDDVPRIDLDAKLIHHVYINLLTNAIKYTPARGSIEIEVYRKGDEIINKVSDTGYGIPEDAQAKIFDRFFRAANVVKLETDGTGLGLYMARQIVEASGGRIWFKSKEGEGSTFWFTLPASGMKPHKGDVRIDS